MNPSADFLRRIVNCLALVASLSARNAASEAGEAGLSIRNPKSHGFVGYICTLTAIYPAFFCVLPKILEVEKNRSRKLKHRAP